jgi:hypothetical protein
LHAMHADQRESDPLDKNVVSIIALKHACCSVFSGSSVCVATTLTDVNNMFQLYLPILEILSLYSEGGVQ